MIGFSYLWNAVLQSGGGDSPPQLTVDFEAQTFTVSAFGLNAAPRLTADFDAQTLTVTEF